jgi:hypothetical protein
VHGIGKRSLLPRSRLGSLRLTIDCRERAAQLLGASDGLPAPPSGFDAHPLGFSVSISGNDSVNGHGGAVVGDVAIIVAFALLVLVLAASRSVWKRRTLEQGMAWTRYPACIVFPVALLLQPIVLSSTVLIAWGGDGVALGATGLLLSCLLVAAGTAAYVRQFSLTFTFRRKVPMQRNGQFLRLVSWLMSEKGDWIPACVKAATASVKQNTTTALNEAEDEPKLDTTELRRFGVLFDPYDERCAWFLAVELGYNVLQGIACGLQMTLGCGWSAWLVAGLSIVFFFSIVVLQPHGRRLDVALQALLAFLQALGAVLASVAIGTEDNALALALFDAAEDTVSAASIAATILGVYEVLKAIYEQLAKRQRKLRATGAVTARAPACVALLSESIATDELLPAPVPPPKSPSPPPRTAGPDVRARPFSLPKPSSSLASRSAPPPRGAARLPEMSMLSAFDVDRLEADGLRPLLFSRNELPTRSGRAAAVPKRAKEDELLDGLDDLLTPQTAASTALGDAPPPEVVTSLDDLLLELFEANQAADPTLPLDIL